MAKKILVRLPVLFMAVIGLGKKFLEKVLFCMSSFHLQPVGSIVKGDVAGGL